MNLLDVKNLSVAFINNEVSQPVIKNLNFSVPDNKIMGIAGESGSGKTITALSILQLLDKNAKIISGTIQWNADNKIVELNSLSQDQIRKYRGAEISMIFQEPMSALNPLLTCGFQASEVLVAHRYGTKAEIKNRILECFKAVGLENTERIYKSHPYELSGGQLQRVLIAMAISCKPKLIIADEPTTALDVSLQKRIIDLLRHLKAELKFSMIFISHDLDLIRSFCDEVVIMQKGEILESGATHEVFKNPKHPYTKGLIHCRPPLNFKVKRLKTLASSLTSISNHLESLSESKITDDVLKERYTSLEKQNELISVRNLEVSYQKSQHLFKSSKDVIQAVKGVSIAIRKGEILGLVGESGSGKSSLGKAILNLTKASSGSIKYQNTELTSLTQRQWRSYRKHLQVIFQDPYSALNPRQTIEDALTEPMIVHRLFHNQYQRKENAVHLLELVGLNAEHLKRYPHQFSGGQRQRICIARALTVQPEFIVCDEPVSALDVSIQAQILNLLQDLKEKLSLSYLFISHDLSVVHFISDRIAVMKNGEIVEQGYANDIINAPQTEYTKSLIAAVPSEF